MKLGLKPNKNRIKSLILLHVPGNAHKHVNQAAQGLLFRGYCSAVLVPSLAFSACKKTEGNGN